MGFQIAFILINLAVPTWLWMRKGTDKIPPTEVHWEVFANNLERVVANGGGFAPCEDRKAMLYFKQMCEASKDKLEGGDSWIIERVGPDTVFSCEVSAKYLRMTWVLDSGEDHDLSCGNQNRTQLTQLAPTFEFTFKGLLRRIEFNSANGSRESVMIKSCRQKLKAAQMMKALPSNDEEFVRALGQSSGDPSDVLRANRLCFTYDIAAGWKPFREKYSLPRQAAAP